MHKAIQGAACILKWIFYLAMFLICLSIIGGIYGLYWAFTTKPGTTVSVPKAVAGSGGSSSATTTSGSGSAASSSGSSAGTSGSSGTSKSSSSSGSVIVKFKHSSSSGSSSGGSSSAGKSSGSGSSGSGSGSSGSGSGSLTKSGSGAPAGSGTVKVTITSGMLAFAKIFLTIYLLVMFLILYMIHSMYKAVLDLDHAAIDRRLKRFVCLYIVTWIFTIYEANKSGRINTRFILGGLVDILFFVLFSWYYHRFGNLCDIKAWYANNKHEAEDIDFNEDYTM